VWSFVPIDTIAGYDNISMLGGKVLKKVLVFLIITSVTLGLFLGIKAAIKNLNNDSNTKQINVNDIKHINELNIPLIEVKTLNPILNSNKQVSDILKFIYEPLIDINSDNKLVPCLSTEWAKIDEYNWIIKTRKNVKWHDDSIFSSDDVLFTIDKIKEAQQSIYKTNIDNISEISIIDTDSIKFTLINPDSLFPYKLTFPIIPKHYYRDVKIDDENKNNRPIGTGSFKYVVTQENKIELEKNTNWWNNTKFVLSKIYLYKYGTYGEAIKAFKSSEIDMIITSMIDWNKKFGTIGINTYKFETEEFETLIPNTNKTILLDSSVRRAILYAINREKIILDVYNDNASISDTLIHKDSWLYDGSEYSQFDIEKAKQLLINTGWKQENGTWTKTIDKKKYTLKANLMVNEDNKERCLAAEIIKNNLDDLGMKITINKVNWNTYRENLNSGNFDLALCGINTISDFDLLLTAKTDGILNYSQYKNSFFDEIYESTDISQSGLYSIYKQVQDEYKKEVPYIGLYFKTNILITNKSVNGEIHPTWWNSYNNIINWMK
jgi:peptide/nickel transport system substrate-binding protein